MMLSSHISDGLYPRSEHKEYSFQGERLLRGRHKIHPYPAMLHPLLVDSLIDQYASPKDVIFDPFCGSGVTLVQSQASGYESIGFDINPMALLIARVKTGSYQKATLLKESQDLKEFLCSQGRLDPEVIDIPQITNRDYWYCQSVLHDLGRIRWALKHRSYEYRDFFLTVFAFVCRNQSLTKNSEFKRYRMKAEKIARSTHDVFPKFFSHLEAMMEVFLNTETSRAPSQVILAYSDHQIPPSITYDLVISSPPYGDSRTTVAYGQYTSFGYEWIGCLNPYYDQNYKMNKESLGQKSEVIEQLREHPILMEVVQKIKGVNAKRADEVLYFFNGYYKALRNISKNLNKKGRVCFVVGNRTVGGFQIPMDQITASFLSSMGLDFQEIFVRTIHNKVMPPKNSPSNQPGVKSKTMSHEYGVVFSKG